MRNELCRLQRIPGSEARRKEQRNKNARARYCKGCRPRDKKCAFLKRKCELLLNNKERFCYECNSFPCERLERIDKRYQTYFRTSLIENLEAIRKNGLPEFLKKEEKKWQYQKCGETICCHNGICFNCSLDRLKNKKKLYRWED